MQLPKHMSCRLQLCLEGLGLSLQMFQLDAFPLENPVDTFPPENPQHRSIHGYLLDDRTRRSMVIETKMGFESKPLAIRYNTATLNHMHGYMLQN
jgi:hypothetical protein